MLPQTWTLLQYSAATAVTAYSSMLSELANGEAAHTSSFKEKCLGAHDDSGLLGALRGPLVRQASIAAVTVP